MADDLAAIRDRLEAERLRPMARWQPLSAHQEEKRRRSLARFSETQRALLDNPEWRTPPEELEPTS